MALKALVAAFFVRLLPSNKKGKYYMLLEYFSQLYRNIVPLPLWVRYLSDKKFSGIVFAVLITATYLMIKGVVIFLSLRDLYRAVISVIKEPVSYNLKQPIILFKVWDNDMWNVYHWYVVYSISRIEINCLYLYR